MGPGSRRRGREERRRRQEQAAAKAAKLAAQQPLQVPQVAAKGPAAAQLPTPVSPQPVPPSKISFFEYAALVLALVPGALALSGKFNVVATYVLLALASVVIVIGVWRQPRLTRLGVPAIAAVILSLCGYLFTPDPVPGYSGILYPKVTTIFSPKKPPDRVFELGENGAMLKIDNPELAAAINFFNAAKLTLEEINGRLMVSTQIRDQSGDLVAELIRNAWKVSPPPKTWDRNYNSDSLEVKNAKGQIVLQVRVFPDRIRILGEWWGQDGMGVRIIRPPGQRSLILILDQRVHPNEPHIEPIFEYPSEAHFGELRK